ncbi:MAG: aminoglycoside phosphotransferase family protein [Microlunatus sp.]|nr:aminoglycoside phosphotransferase family protein [Microlunatus sp.]
MQAAEVRRAVAAALATASALGLAADDAVVLQDSNKLALRLLPADVLARVAPLTQQVARFEVDLARRLAAAGCPVAVLDPRVEPQVHRRDGFAITLWTYYESVSSRAVPAADYADALRRLHAGMRRVQLPTPHFTDRIESAQQLVADRVRTPELTDPDRELLADTLATLRRVLRARGQEQLLHGEPHPGNLLPTKNGPLFIDLETCCRGPVEFDVAHAPDEVAEHYPGLDHDVLRDCRTVVLAMITTWRWDRDDRFPDGRRMGNEWLGRLREAVDGRRN